MVYMGTADICSVQQVFESLGDLQCSVHTWCGRPLLKYNAQKQQNKQTNSHILNRNKNVERNQVLTPLPFKIIYTNIVLVVNYNNTYAATNS